MTTLANFDDNLNAFRRYLDNLSPILDSYKRAQEDLYRLAQLMPVRDLMRVIEASREQLIISPEIIALRTSLATAIRPLPDFSQLASVVTRDSTTLSQSLARLNTQVEAAHLLGKITLPEYEVEEETRERVVEEESERQLIEVVPPDALETLKRVEFAPIVLLDRALRDPDIMLKLDSREFEEFVAELVNQLGFNDVMLTDPSGDGGRDVVGTKTVHDIPIIFAFECKRYAPDRPVGPHFARALLGTISHVDTRATKGVLVTTSYFTSGAQTYMLTEPNLDGRDFDGIVEWLREYGARTAT